MERLENKHEYPESERIIFESEHPFWECTDFESDEKGEMPDAIDYDKWADDDLYFSFYKNIELKYRELAYILKKRWLDSCAKNNLLFDNMRGKFLFEECVKKTYEAEKEKREWQKKIINRLIMEGRIKE